MFDELAIDKLIKRADRILNNNVIWWWDKKAIKKPGALRNADYNDN